MYVSKVKIHKDMIPVFFKQGFNSIILKGIDKTLQDRLSLLDVDNVSDDGQQEMF